MFFCNPLLNFNILKQYFNQMMRHQNQPNRIMSYFDVTCAIQNKKSCDVKIFHESFARSLCLKKHLDLSSGTCQSHFSKKIIYNKNKSVMEEISLS